MFDAIYKLYVHYVLQLMKCYPDVIWNVLMIKLFNSAQPSDMITATDWKWPYDY